MSPNFCGTANRLLAVPVSKCVVSGLEPAAGRLGIARPYDLRHSYASLRFAERANPAEIAEEMGHSLEVLFSTYAHVITELKGIGASVGRGSDPRSP